MKVHIVGGGPAGTITGICATRAGHEIVISEEHKVCGIPENCSGLFSREGLESLKDVVDYKKTIINQINGADIHFGKELLRIRKKEPVAYVCNRAEIDQNLAENAQNEGVKINFGERINETFHAENIVGADGPLSFVAKHFGFGKINRYVATLQSTIKYQAEDKNAVEVFMSNTLFPGLFGWIIPQDEETAEFGVGVELPNRVRPAWEWLLKIKNIKEVQKPTGAVIPIAIRTQSAKTVGKKRILLVGDAAGQVKATTGGGVIYGGNCAKIAAKNIGSPLKYELEWRGKYLLDLKFHGLVHDFLNRQNDEEMENIGKILNKIECGRYLSEYGHMDKPTKMFRHQLLWHIAKNIDNIFFL